MGGVKMKQSVLPNFRDRHPMRDDCAWACLAVRETGWWTVFSPVKPVGQVQYDTYYASCHGTDGKKIPTADLSDPKVSGQYIRSINLLVDLQKPVNGGHHLVNPALPTNAGQAQAILAPILTHLQGLSGGGAATQARFTLSNYLDAMVGYKRPADYQSGCKNKVASTLAVMSCTAKDLLNPEGIGRAFINTIIVAIPSTLLPEFFGALAANGFAWLDFRGRTWLFALLVGLQIIPLQMTLVPIARLYVRLGLQGSFLGVWLFHTGFGLPYAIFLLWNFMKNLPREIFESSYLDGASHWTAFWTLAMPLTLPAIVSLAIFQFLWIWDDFLVAKVFLSSKPVLTVQITNLIDPLGGNWNILTGAAFLSFIIPMVVFYIPEILHAWLVIGFGERIKHQHVSQALVHECNFL
jgi:alpha-glucoside transport system permease protein